MRSMQLSNCSSVILFSLYYSTSSFHTKLDTICNPSMICLLTMLILFISLSLPVFLFHIFSHIGRSIHCTDQVVEFMDTFKYLQINFSYTLLHRFCRKKLHDITLLGHVPSERPDQYILCRDFHVISVMKCNVPFKLQRSLNP